MNFVDKTDLNKIQIKILQKDMDAIDKKIKIITQKLFCKSVKNNKEYGGWIVSNYLSGKFRFLIRRGGKLGTVNLNPTPRGNYYPEAATHTHGDIDPILKVRFLLEIFIIFTIVL